MRDASLDEKTLAYWSLSRAYSGTSNEVIATGKALVTTKLALQGLDPNRPLAKRFYEIQQAIIFNNPSQTKQAQAS